MAQVFISHSKKDQVLINNVATMLKNVNEEPILMEYIPKSTRDKPNWSLIRKHVSESEYLMLFKTDNAIVTDFTKSWIIYEVGLAAAYEKRLFIFERKGPMIKFPIPYVTDYMIFDPSQVGDFLTIQSIVASSKKSNSAINVTCKRCRTTFRYYSLEKFPFNCPVCLTEITDSKSIKKND